MPTPSPCPDPDALGPGPRRAVLLGLTLAAVWLGGAGLRGGLPYYHHVDEPHFVGTALGMMRHGTFDPGWFGNPGSTVIYPLYAVFSVWYALIGDGAPPYANPELDGYLAEGGWVEFYAIGRAVNLGYFAALPALIWLAGRRVVGERAALGGAVLTLASPLVVEHAHVVRTDSAGAAFALLALWRQLVALDRDRRADWVLAGLAVGLACSTRYLLLALAPGLGVAAWAQVRSHGWRYAAGRLAIGLGAMLAGFALSTPYFLLDLPQALSSIRGEARGEHLGADGLDVAGKLRFYLLSALPAQLPSWILVGAGAALAGWRRPWPLAVALAFAGSLLAGISLLSLHWDRWIIPIVPPLAALAALPLATVARRAGRFEPVLIVVLLAGAAWGPAWRTGELVRQKWLPDTRILAREWIAAHLPAGSRVVGEWYTAPLHGLDYDWREIADVGRHGLPHLRRAGVRYVVISSRFVADYRADPARYASELEAYDELEARGRCRAHFAALPGQVAGVSIWIYELDPEER